MLKNSCTYMVFFRGLLYQWRWMFFKRGTNTSLYFPLQTSSDNGSFYSPSPWRMYTACAEQGPLPGLASLFSVWFSSSKHHFLQWAAPELFSTPSSLIPFSGWVWCPLGTPGSSSMRSCWLVALLDCFLCLCHCGLCGDSDMPGSSPGLKHPAYF